MGNMSAFVNALYNPLLIFHTAMDASLLGGIFLVHFPAGSCVGRQGVEKRGRLSVIAQ